MESIEERVLELFETAAIQPEKKRKFAQMAISEVGDAKRIKYTEEMRALEGELQETHHREILGLKDAHIKQMLELKDAHHREVDAHIKQMLELKDAHHREVLNLKDAHQTEILELREQIHQITKKLLEKQIEFQNEFLSKEKFEMEQKERIKILLMSGSIVNCRSLIEMELNRIASNWKDNVDMLWSRIDTCCNIYTIEELIPYVSGGYNYQKQEITILETELQDFFHYLEYRKKNEKSYILKTIAENLKPEKIITKFGSLHAAIEDIRQNVPSLYSKLSESTHNTGWLFEGKIVLPRPVPPMTQSCCLALATLFKQWGYEFIEPTTNIERSTV
eukprot:TRINITY_DN26815_c0_g1_i1.p1 TRINITY_DN26815_c0_g1~~TRINITY_DN26815_c0_g1_i1.p1  ORF type:complete len:334 (-),score=89.59 TRINITY_DN26815_c0_g1_i1:50-1051(-)